MSEDNYKNTSHPAVIADVIKKALLSGKPKTRYVAGKMAKMILFMKSVLSDKMFDKMILSVIDK